jgi:hypothetical protein
MPKRVLQTLEETFPAVRESMVSAFAYLHRKEFYCHQLSDLMAKGAEHFKTSLC